MDPAIALVDEGSAVTTLEERLRRFGQDDHQRVFGMDAGRLLEEVFEVEEIRGEDCPEEILPVVGPADYDANVLFLLQDVGGGVLVRRPCGGMSFRGAFFLEKGRTGVLVTSRGILEKNTCTTNKCLL